MGQIGYMWVLKVHFVAREGLCGFVAKCMAQLASVKAMWSTGFTCVVSVLRAGVGALTQHRELMHLAGI